MNPLLDLETAQACIRAHCAALETEPVPLDQAWGRMLREPVRADRDQPPFDRSTVDGYAMGRDDASDQFRVVGEVRAGEFKVLKLNAGEAVRIATGAALPDPHLRVVMQESVTVRGDVITLEQRDDDGHVRSRGEEARQGELLVPAGVRLTAGALAVLALAGCAQPRVTRAARVLHWVTGDEVVPAGDEPAPGQIRDTNSILIQALLRAWGCQVKSGRLPEDLEAAWDRLDTARARRADLLLLSGGASVGRHDATPALLERLGFQVQFHGVRVRPGKPLLFATRERQVAFGLPGNPLSHWVSFHAFVAPALAVFAGGTAAPREAQGRLAEPLTDASGDRETLWPAEAEVDGTGWRLRPLPWRSSGDLLPLRTANALLRIPPGTARLAAESPVRFFRTD